MKKQLKQVEEFHKAFKVPVLTAPEIPAMERCQLRIKLIQEELNELQQAIEDKDMIEVMDALTDIQYVVLGSVLEFGLSDRFEQMFDEVQRSNMSKLDDAGLPIFREDGKVLKSNNFFPPNFNRFLEENLQTTE